MSKINVNTWEPETGTAATLMATGDTVTLPSGAILSVASGGDINVASGGEIDIASGATLDVNGTLDVTGATVTGLSAGKVLQVVSSMLTGAASTASQTLVTTGLEGTITPSATSSKILISISFAMAAAGGDAAPQVQLYKGASVISGSLGDVQGSRGQASVGMAYNATQSTAFNYLDSPSTTSATTYKLMYATYNSGQTLYMNLMSTGNSAYYYTSPATMILMEIEG